MPKKRRQSPIVDISPDSPIIQLAISPDSSEDEREREGNNTHNSDFPPLKKTTSPKPQSSLMQSSPTDPTDLLNNANLNISNLNEAISLLHEGKSLTKTNKAAIIKIIKTAIQGFESLVNNPPIITEIIRQTIAETTKHITALLPTQLPPAQYKPQYSQIIKAPTAPVIPKSKPALIVSSKKEVKNSKDTMDQWKSCISFKDTNFAPSNIKLISNNKIRIEFDNISQRDTALEKTKNTNSTISAEIPKSLQPSIILKGIPEDIQPNQIIDIITNQNDSIKNNIKTPKDITYSFKRNNRNNKLYNAIFRTTPDIFKAIIQSTKVNIDHYRVHAEEYIPILQCYKCLKLGHTRSHCTQTQSICSYCSSKDHEYKTCPHKNDPTKINCHNCTSQNQTFNNTNKRPTQHSATSNTCPCIIQTTRITQSRIDYG